MGKLIKFLVWTTGIGIVLIAVAAIAIPLVVDPNDYKPQISKLVSDKTGRDLTIDGAIKLSIFPWLGLEIGQVKLANAAGFSEPSMVEIGSAEVKVKLWPLITKNLEMDTVTLTGAKINLQRLADGRTNWQDLASGAESAETTRDAAAASGDSGFALNSISLGGVDLQGASVHWDDALGETVTLDPLNLTTGPISLDDAFSLQADAGIALPAQQLSTQINLATEIKIDIANQRFTANGVDFSATASGGPVPGGTQTLKLNADGVFDGSAGTLSVTNLTINAAGVDLAGQLSGANLNDSPELSGALTSGQFNPRELAESLGQSLPASADANVLQNASGGVDFAIAGARINLGNINLALDDSTLLGSLSTNSAGAIAFDLVLDQIDVDRYLPAPTPGEAPVVETPGSQTAKSAAAGTLPLEAIRNLNLDGQMKIGRLKVNRLSATNIVLPVKALNGLLGLQPTADLYAGTYRGNISIDATGDTPKISLDEKLSDVQAGALLTDLTGEDRISGATNASAKLTMRGADPTQIQQTLNGTAEFSFTDGAVSGINIGQMLRQAKAQLGGEAVAAGTEPVKTDFSELTASVVIRDGIVENNDLSAKSPLLRVSGEGTANLPGQLVDYDLIVALVKSAEGQGGGDLGDLAGIPIPIKIEGSFSDPSIGLDMAGIVEQQAQQLVDKEADKLLEKAKEKIGEELGDKIGEQAGEALKGEAGKLLKGLFGQ